MGLMSAVTNSSPVLRSVSMMVLCGALSASTPATVRAQGSTTAPDPDISPTGHLAAAAGILRAVPADSLKSDARKRIALLREHFDELGRAYAANSTPFIPPASDESGKAPSRPLNWKEQFSTVEGDLAKLIGGGSTLGPQTAGAALIVGDQTTSSAPQAAEPSSTSGTPMPSSPNGTAGPVDGLAPGTSAPAASSVAMPSGSPAISGAVVSEIGLKDLDPAVRHQLEYFRLELELFFASTMMGRDSS